MLIDTKNIVSITEANQNFSLIARKVEQDGPVLIMKNNKPRFIVLAYKESDAQCAADDSVAAVADAILSRHAGAMEKLGQ